MSAGGAATKRLTLAQAADQWVRGKKQAVRGKALMEEAAPILLKYFARTGRTSYKDRIGLVLTPSKLILDQQKVKEELGRRLSQFQKRTKPSKSLTLLEPDAEQRDGADA